MREEATCILCVVCEHVCICTCVYTETRDKNQCLPLLLATLFLEAGGGSPAEPGSPRNLNKGAQCLIGRFSTALSNSPAPRSVFLAFIVSRFMGFGYWFVFVLKVTCLFSGTCWLWTQCLCFSLLGGGSTHNIPPHLAHSAAKAGFKPCVAKNGLVFLIPLPLPPTYWLIATFISW